MRILLLILVGISFLTKMQACEKCAEKFYKHLNEMKDRYKTMTKEHPELERDFILIKEGEKIGIKIAADILTFHHPEMKLSVNQWKALQWNDKKEEKKEL